MVREVEISTLDLRYASYRLRNSVQEKRLLGSMSERGIEEPFTVADAVAILVKYAQPVDPNPAWANVYQEGLRSFVGRLHELQEKQARTK